MRSSPSDIFHRNLHNHTFFRRHLRLPRKRLLLCCSSRSRRIINIFPFEAKKPQTDYVNHWIRLNNRRFHAFLHLFVRGVLKIFHPTHRTPHSNIITHNSNPCRFRNFPNSKQTSQLDSSLFRRSSGHIFSSFNSHIKRNLDSLLSSSLRRVCCISWTGGKNSS